MGNTLKEYDQLFEWFLTRQIPVEEFQAAFLHRFKNEAPLDQASFKLLDELFGDVDSFTMDPELLSEKPNLYLDEPALRRRVQEVGAHLRALRE